MILKYYSQFLEEFSDLDRGVQKQLHKKLSEIAETDFSTFLPQPLKGNRFKGLYKLRIGDWRLIYRIVNSEIHFITLGHRSSVYR